MKKAGLLRRRLSRDRKSDQKKKKKSKKVSSKNIKSQGDFFGKITDERRYYLFSTDIGNSRLG
jgi:hypothetical protein